MFNEEKIKALRKERAIYVEESKSLAAQISDIKDSVDKRNSISRKTAQENVSILKTWTNRYNKLELEIVKINSEIKSLVGDDDIFVQVVKEILPAKIIDTIIQECKNRRDGKQPQIVPIDFTRPTEYKTQISTLKSKLKEYYLIIENARQQLTTYISKNEPRNNKEDFLNGISSLNKSLPPTTVIIKDKRILNF